MRGCPEPSGQKDPNSKGKKEIKNEGRLKETEQKE
jgi:hypothetical protein